MKQLMKYWSLFAGVVFFLSACQLNTPVPPTPSPTPTLSPTSADTATPAPTSTPPPTETPTPTPLPFTVGIWPALGAPSASTVDQPFALQEGELAAAGLRQGQGWTSGGWPVPGALYTEGDSVYLRGRLLCFQNETPVTCDYGSFGLQVGGGTQEKVSGTAGFIGSLDACEIKEEVDLTVRFECVWIPDRGFGIPFEYIWLRVISGQGGQKQDVYLELFGITWSGVTPTPTP